MAAAFTHYLQDRVVKHLLNHTVWTPPSVLYLAAYTGPPTEAGGGFEAIGYTRVAINASMAFDGANSGTFSNNAIVMFTDLPLDITVVGAATFDAASAGNMHTFCQLATPKTITDGTLPFPIGNLVIGVT